MPDAVEPGKGVWTNPDIYNPRSYTDCHGNNRSREQAIDCLLVALGISANGANSINSPLLTTSSVDKISDRATKKYGSCGRGYDEDVAQRYSITGIEPDGDKGQQSQKQVSNSGKDEATITAALGATIAATGADVSVLDDHLINNRTTAKHEHHNDRNSIYLAKSIPSGTVNDGRCEAVNEHEREQELNDGAWLSVRRK
eukprot:TRINITY_DN5375_c0_g1_i2.p2 TRINITY_DN5375_c0_g1~~TRINITY_DN5375_c0_g1_i2.p2  ORF type:complete len:199 (+),score=21.61 TRINITY_DN5375_c0_g1_i2:508-1104(+)